MICNLCGIPMKTIEGSERGNMDKDYYYTEEIKKCPTCGVMVREIYEASKIKEDNLPIIQEK